MKSILVTLGLLVATVAHAGHNAGGFFWDYPNSYSAYNGSELGGTWIVQPNGLGATGAANLENHAKHLADGSPSWHWLWLFMTSVNAKQGSPEFIASYTFDNDGADFNLHSWSCSVADPCDLPGGGTTNSNTFIFSRKMKDYPQYLFDCVDDGGHPQRCMSFIIKTVEVGGPVADGDPARWNVTVSLWNEPGGVWDELWSHEYGYDKVNCHEGDCLSTNGDWLATMEVVEYPFNSCSTSAPCTLPKMREIGVQDLYFIDDTGPVDLESPGVGFTPPVTIGGPAGGWGTGDSVIGAPWQTEHRTDNHSFGMGNFFNVPTVTPCN